MYRLPGKQQYSTKYFYNGYVYYNDKRSENTIFRCANKNDLLCTAKVYVDNFGTENETHEVAGNHSHPSDPLFLLKHQFSEELKRAAVDPAQSFIRIYETVIQKEE